MRWQVAFAAGLGGAVVMSVFLALARALGLRINLEMLIAVTLGLPPSPLGWASGMIFHLLLGGGFGVVYAAIFHGVLHRSGWLAGAEVGIVHAMAAGFLLGMIPIINPFVAAVMPVPGAFFSAFGPIGILTFFLMHVIFGAIVGAAYPAVETLKPHAVR